LIVVHLLGTHMSYQYRYPPTFDKFKDRNGVPAGVRDDQVPTYNSYDNAVLYNDFVVSSLIKDYAKSDPNGFLLYLSDHGEDVSTRPAMAPWGATKASRQHRCTPFRSWPGPRRNGAKP
jgi:heptose-I-phosphate ethanolaminephosphotransferase